MTTAPDDRDNPWTREGADYARLRDSVLRTSPTERLHALEELMALAENCGALDRCRRKEAEYWARVWS